MINFHPHPNTLATAIRDLVQVYGWEKFGIFYDSPERLFQIQEILVTHSTSGGQIMKPVLRRLPLNNNYRSILREMDRDLEIKNILVHCCIKTTEILLTQAQEVGILNHQFSYILSTLDFHTLPIEKFQFGEANITSFRLIDTSDPEVLNVLSELNQMLPKPPKASNCGLNFDRVPLHGLPTEIALVYDAMKVYAKTLHALDTTQRINLKSLRCNQSETWGYGVTILNYIKMVPMQGLSGRIDFNNTAFRTDVSLDLISLTKNGIQKVGIWNQNRYPLTKFKWLELGTNGINSLDRKFSQDENFFNMTLTVTTVMSEPFCMLKKGKNFVGNERFEGYIVDLLQKLSKILRFRFTIRPITMKEGGSKVQNNQWNDVVKEIVTKNADIGIGDLTMTGARQKFVDFVPFMHHGVSIVYTTTKPKVQKWFSFLLPFSNDLWISIGGAYLFVSILLYLITRISPYEWTHEFPCRSNTDVMTKLSFWNSFWQILEVLFRQKTEINFRANSTRAFIASWSLFTLILVSTYTANLVTFSLLSEMEKEIRGVGDLLENSKIQFGCIQGGTTMSYFQDSGTDLAKSIWENMKNDALNSFKKNVSEGIEHVVNSQGKFAFFAESPIIEYNIERTCGITQIGGLMSSVAYGIAFRKDSGLLEPFNSAVLKLQDSTALADLKEKWWKLKDTEKICVNDRIKKKVKPLRIQHFYGLFLVLLSGAFVGVVLTFCEFFWTGRKIVAGERRHELGKDLEFALKCRGNVKLVKKNSRSVPSIISEDTGTPYLDLGINSYGFPNFENIQNGGESISREVLSFD